MKYYNSLYDLRKTNDWKETFKTGTSVHFFEHGFTFVIAQCNETPYVVRMYTYDESFEENNMYSFDNRVVALNKDRFVKDMFRIADLVEANKIATAIPASLDDMELDIFNTESNVYKFLDEHKLIKLKDWCAEQLDEHGVFIFCEEMHNFPLFSLVKDGIYIIQVC